MRAGTLNRKISIERRTDTRDAAGQPIPTWSRIGVTRWADRAQANGWERFGSDQFISREQVVWLVRWTTDLASLNPKDRIVYPVTTTPVASQIYEVLAVTEVERRRELRILTARRAEV
jgi:SPP1 family predicted phage head-tail adaptor